MATFLGASNLETAIKLLGERGITFDRLLCPRRPKGFWLIQTPVSDDLTYFMQGNADVGYFAKPTYTLAINEEPRVWGEHLLDGYEEIPIP